MTVTIACDLEGGRRVTNAWPLWVFPQPAKDPDRRVGLFDPADHLAGLEAAIGVSPVPLRAATGAAGDDKGPVPVILATAWRPDMLRYVADGGRLLLLQPGPSASRHRRRPARRRASVLARGDAPLREHPVWGDFPHEKTTDALFYGLACDAAFDIPKVRQALGLPEADRPGARLTSLLTRVDARSFALHGYLLHAQIGNGTLLMTTLRPQGGLGRPAFRSFPQCCGRVPAAAVAGFVGCGESDIGVKAIVKTMAGPGAELLDVPCRPCPRRCAGPGANGLDLRDRLPRVRLGRLGRRSRQAAGHDGP
jgi:hypothetical protein